MKICLIESADSEESDQTAYQTQSDLDFHCSRFKTCGSREIAVKKKNENLFL